MSTLGKFRFKFSRIPQRIPLPWADDPSSKRLLKQTEWLIGDKGRLPRHYVAFYKQWEIGPQTVIHEQRSNSRFEKDEFGNVRRIQVPKIPVMYPDEFHLGLWGGEGIIKGGIEPEQGKHKKPPEHYAAKENYWIPKLHLGVVYSEILDKHIEVAMTERAQRLIDEAFGLDMYLLKTEVNEIYSHFGLKLKREMLLTLANPEEELHPYDSAKRKEILEKYKKFIVPHEEADWHGLSLSEALHKQHTIDRIEEEDSIRPRKEEFRKDVFAKLQAGRSEDLGFLYELKTDEENVSEPGLVSSTMASLKSFGKKKKK